jgi:histidine triad (HIT) family protein
VELGEPQDTTARVVVATENEHRVSETDVPESSCDFCAIAQGRDKTTRVVAEGTEWIAFFPLNPATPGHTLVIPRRHVSDLWHVDEALGSALMSASIRVGRAIRDGLRPEGMNLITSSGYAAEQSVFHLHLHLVPRWRSDGFGRIWPTEKTMDEDLQDDVLADIQRALHDRPAL